MATYLHEGSDGRLIEYRRHPYCSTVLHMEARVLRRDGYPHSSDDGAWYRVTDAHLLWLQRDDGTEIIDMLSAEKEAT